MMAIWSRTATGPPFDFWGITSQARQPGKPRLRRSFALPSPALSASTLPYDHDAVVRMPCTRSLLFRDFADYYFARSRVRAAFFAEADLAAAVRVRAAVRVCWDNASGETAALLSRLRAFNVACDRLAEGFFPELAFSRSRWALRRVASEVLPGFGGASFTPARRALESPMAMACFAERAPCFPARISSISSRTNSPAWVEADFPSRASRRARSIVWFLGIID
jgi:hypothetical protein